MSKKMQRVVVGAVALGLGLTGLVAVTEADAAVPARTYKNCAALNRVYPHGVGKVGARDRTSGRPVTNFTRNNKVYALNTARDRDKDGIACERR